jgi:hypothetical protein
MNTNAISNLEYNILISEMVILGRIYENLFLDSQDCQILLTLNWSCWHFIINCRVDETCVTLHRSPIKYELEVMITPKPHQFL